MLLVVAYLLGCGIASYVLFNGVGLGLVVHWLTSKNDDDGLPPWWVG